MNLKVDHKADALYLRFDDAKIVESEQVAPGVVVDFDDRNRVIGVEVLAVSARAPRSGISNAAARDPAAPALVRERPVRKYGK